MRFEAAAPPPRLDSFVELFWYWEGYPTPRGRERLLPIGTSELIIDLAGSESVLVGPHSEPTIIERSEDEAVIGVHFKPGGAFPFLGMPADELTNQTVMLEDLWGPVAAADLRDQLAAAPTTAARFSLLERFLTRDVAWHPAVAFAVDEICRDPGSAVGDIADRAGVSRRRLADVFREQVGLTPKVFGRIRRFQGVLQRIGDAPAVDWSETALACGYFDQAHLIRDFNEFCGMTPATWLISRGDHPNHIPIGD
jgi:AraC-like DNA-binding protein